MVARLRPYGLQIHMLIYTPLLLAADSRLHDAVPQLGLGVLTFVTLGLLTSRVSPDIRRQAWLCVLLSTGFEIFGSLVWGVYRYRFHNVPLYVPPGHGMVYLFGLTLARAPLFTLHTARVKRVILAVATIWAAAGLTVLVPFTGRVDVAGALCLPLFYWFVTRSPRGAVFAAIFIATSELELFGTALRDWTWLPVAPWSHIGVGNPPSAIAGAYSVIDGSVLAVLAAVAALRRNQPALGRRRGRPAGGRVLTDVEAELQR